MNQRANHATLAEDALIDQAVEAAVKKTFAIIGVDVDKPESVESFREDLRFGRRLRRMSDHANIVMVGMIVSALLLALWIGVKELAGKH